MTNQKTSVKQAVKYALFMHHYGRSIGGARRRRIIERN